jgi:hypothetical protein
MRLVRISSEGRGPWQCDGNRPIIVDDWWQTVRNPTEKVFEIDVEWRVVTVEAARDDFGVTIPPEALR